jgi:hypothetical protein
VSDLLKAPHNEVLVNYPVSRLVNSVRNNDASLVVPLEAHPTAPRGRCRYSVDPAPRASDLPSDIAYDSEM